MSDLKARAEALLVQCGPHDFGMPEFGCNCSPEGDYRPVISQLLTEWEDTKQQLHHVADDLDKVGDAVKQMAVNHRTDIPALMEELNRLRSEVRMLRAKVTRQESELAELDRENASLVGRAQHLEEQLAAATLEGQP
jgi:chromosome segregation ATPase